jgi:hypothetical protein
VLGLAVRRDANTSLVDTDGDYAPIQVDATGSVKVAIISGAGSGGTALADGATFTAGTTSMTPIGGVRDDAASTTVAEDKAGWCRITTNRALHVNLRDAVGNEISKLEDAAHTTGDPGVQVLAVRRDADTSGVDTDADYGSLLLDAIGFLKVRGRLSNTVSPTMGTLTAGAYAAADTIGAKLTLTSIVPITAGSGTIQSVIVTSKSTQTFSPEVFFFNADPSSSTFTDNGVFTVNSADMPKLIGVATCDVVKALGTGSIHQSSNTGLPFKLASGTSAYAVIVTRVAVTLASTSDVVLQVNVLPD